MVLIDECDLLCGKLVFMFALDLAECYMIGEGEPDRLVVVFEELTLHAQNFNFVQFSDIVGHFITLFEAIFEFVCLNELNVVAETFVVVLDARTWITQVNWSEELDYERLSNASLRLDARLDTVVGLCCVHAFARIVESAAESMFSQKLRINFFGSSVSFHSFSFTYNDIGGLRSDTLTWNFNGNSACLGIDSTFLLVISG